MSPSEGRVYAGRTSTDRETSRRAQLIAAGLQVMAESGVQATTVRSVLARSRVAPRYFYESFGSLEDFQVAVFQSVVDTAEARALAALESAPARTPRLRLRAVIAAMVDYALDDRPAATVFFMAAAGSPLLGPRRQAALLRFAQQTDEAVHTSRSPARDALAAHFAIGGFVGAISAVLLDNVHLERDPLIERLTDMFAGVATS